MCGKAKSAHGDSVIVLGKFRDVCKGLMEVTKAIPKEALVASVGKKSVLIQLLLYVSGEKQDMDLEDTMKELNLIALDVAKLTDNVEKFANWWTEMETALGKAEKDASGLKPGMAKLRVQSIQKRWTTIQDDYKQYKSQVIKLQDHLRSGLGSPSG